VSASFPWVVTLVISVARWIAFLPQSRPVMAVHAWMVGLLAVVIAMLVRSL